jgi:phosphatidylinositol-bisphosphatase
MDSGKQEAMDLLLLNGYIGRVGQQTRALLAPSDMLAPLPYRREMIQHWEEFTTREKVRVCMATWNINGGKYVRSVALKNQSMDDWLLDAPKIAGKFDIAPGEYGTPTDIYAIGFQELVDLTASNMVATKEDNRYEWGAELQRVISRDEKYSLVTSVQLVGVCLYVFVRPHLIPFIKDVGVSSSKTGIAGKAGNKGGVAIRLLLHSTSLCFVCSHFAAHQQKVAERNEDFTDIYRRVRFPLNQTIGDNDYVFWCGDLNYRIDLPLGPAKDAISKQDWNKLIRKDQLTREKRYGKIFQSFVEGELNFAPTYKYDQFSNDYDTSEKCRVPAWCDRILWKRKSFLPVGEQKDVRMYDYEATNTDDTSGKYGWHPNNASKIYENELTSGDPSLSWWHPGRLLHYGRAELKTSDHRPVVGLFEIDVFRIDEKKRDAVKGEILKEMGPVDSTVVVRPVGVAYNTLNTPTLVKTLTQYGHIVLVRVMEDVTLVTFLQPRSAVLALAFSGQQVDGIQVEVESNGERTLATNDGNVKLVTASDLMFDNFDDSHDDEMEEIIPPPEDEDDIIIQDENEDLRPHPSSDEDTPPDNEDTSFHIEDDDDVKSCDSLTFDDPPSTHVHPPSTHSTSPPYPPPLYSDVIPVIPAVNSSSSLNELHPNPPRPKPARPPPISKSSSYLPSRPPPPTRTHHSSSITDNHHHTTLANKPRSLTESALTTAPTRPPRPPTRPPPPYKPSKT